MNRPAIAAIFVLVVAASVVRAEGPEFVMSATADLDGDGKADKIVLTPLERKCRGRGAFTLTVNGASITDSVVNKADGFKIMDIDENDRYKEVAVHDRGINGGTYFFFWYNGQELHRTSMDVPDPRLLGHGIVLVRGWQGFWPRLDKYVLTPQHTLKLIPQDLYWVGQEASVREGFPIYSTRKMDRVQARPRVGSDVLIVLCDCEGDLGEWHYLIKTEQGQLGWVHVEALHKLVGLPWAA